MRQETTNAILLFTPFIIGGIIAVINSDSINDITEKAESWIRKTQSDTSSKSGWVSRYIANPVFWIIARFCDWTDDFSHRGLKSGTRVAATLYLIAALIYLFLAAIVVLISLALCALVFYIIFKVVIGTNDNFRQGYETSKDLLSQNRNSDIKPINKNLEKEHSDGGSFSVRALWANGTPAVNVGVMISYMGIMSSFDEKRTNSDGWVEFHNHNNDPGTIWIHSHNMGEHSLSDGKTYSFTI